MLVGGISVVMLVGVAQAAAARITVRPAHGFPTTEFAIGFRAPDASGINGSMRHQYAVSVTGPSRGRRCAGSASSSPSASKAGIRVHVLLNAGKPWCVGTFEGNVKEYEAPVCPPRVACPLFILVRQIGHFSFRVRRPGASGDTTPPTFSGLESAHACTPGAQRPGETTPFTLSWKPATDNVTPSSQIVYDVFESPNRGGEDFAQPTWTTPPGVSSFRTPGLPSHGTFFFVVRARDRAGNEDRNKVEREGVDPCL